MIDEITYQTAKKGYESYCASTYNKSVVTGDTLPPWEELPEAVQTAWFAAAKGMIGYLASLGDII